MEGQQKSIRLTDKKSTRRDKKIPTYLQWIAGVSFTILIAFLGYWVAKVPGFTYLGPLGSAIVIAILYRQFLDYPEQIRLGITFSSKRLLRLAIILYGLKLNIQIIFQEGLGLLVRDAGVIIFAILLTMGLSRLLKADKHISLLLGVGTGVCGAAAIAAVAPIVKTKDEDTAISVGLIALVGTIFSIGYTMLRPVLPLDVLAYGRWSGFSLHELAHVALAAAPAGEAALATALLAKLGRVFLLIPLCLILIYIIKKKNAANKSVESKLEFPWFLVGFILMSVLGTYAQEGSIPILSNVLELIASFSTWCLTAAMVGLGLSVNLREVRDKALKPLLAMSITSIALSILTIFMV